MQNEKRKDKEVTERITRILQQRDEVLRTADLGEQAALVHLDPWTDKAG